MLYEGEGGAQTGRNVTPMDSPQEKMIKIIVSQKGQSKGITDEISKAESQYQG